MEQSLFMIDLYISLLYALISAFFTFCGFFAFFRFVSYNWYDNRWRILGIFSIIYFVATFLQYQIDVPLYSGIIGRMNYILLFIGLPQFFYFIIQIIVPKKR